MFEVNHKILMQILLERLIDSYLQTGINSYLQNELDTKRLGQKDEQRDMNKWKRYKQNIKIKYQNR